MNKIIIIFIMLASFTNYSFSNLKKVEKNNPPQLKNHDILIKNFAPFGKTQDKHSSPVLKDIKNSEQINKKIKIVYKSKPFYFRFSPELRDIKSKKIIIAKIDYDHPNLGRCTYEIVKDLKESKFFGWCNTKKIKRIETQIFEINEKFKKLPLSENKVEAGLNEYSREIIAKINDKHKEIPNK